MEHCNLKPQRSSTIPSYRELINPIPSIAKKWNNIAGSSSPIVNIFDFRNFTNEFTGKINQSKYLEGRLTRQNGFV
jgi:hypothetical protein